MKKIHALLCLVGTLLLTAQPAFAQEEKEVSEQLNRWFMFNAGYSHYTTNLLETPYGQTIGKGASGPSFNFYLLFPLSDHFHFGLSAKMMGTGVRFLFEGEEYRPSSFQRYLAPTCAFSTGITRRHSLTALCSVGSRVEGISSSSAKLPGFFIPVNKRHSLYTNLSLMYAYKINAKYGINLQAEAYTYPNSTFSKTADPFIDTWSISLGIIRYSTYWATRKKRQ